MNRSYFPALDLLGTLRIDKVFFESQYPILFTCLDDSSNLYLCVCCHVNKSEQKWLISHTTPGMIIDLLGDKVTIRDAFLKGEGSKYTVIYNYKEYHVEINNSDDWDSDRSQSLPTAGEYMDAEDNEFEEEIQYYKKLINKNIWKELMIKIESYHQSFAAIDFKRETSVDYIITSNINPDIQYVIEQMSYKASYSDETNARTVINHNETFELIVVNTKQENATSYSGTDEIITNAA